MPGAPPPPNLSPGSATQAAIVRAAAARWHISSQTLWGVYGVETGFGHNVAVSSAGAKGPFQFMDATARQYKVNVLDFTSSAWGAAHYLHDLGADDDPNSAATAKALNGYNGNGGGASVTTYVKGVRDKGKSATKVAGVLPDATGVVHAAGAVADAATAIPDFLGKLNVIFQPHWWLRVGLILGGIIALAAGIVFVGKDFTPIGAVTKLAKGKV